MRKVVQAALSEGELVLDPTMNEAEGKIEAAYRSVSEDDATLLLAFIGRGSMPAATSISCRAMPRRHRQAELEADLAARMAEPRRHRQAELEADLAARMAEIERLGREAQTVQAAHAAELERNHANLKEARRTAPPIRKRRRSSPKRGGFRDAHRRPVATGGTQARNCL